MPFPAWACSWPAAGIIDLRECAHHRSAATGPKPAEGRIRSLLSPAALRRDLHWGFDGFGATTWRPRARESLQNDIVRSYRLDASHRSLRLFLPTSVPAKRNGNAGPSGKKESAPPRRSTPCALSPNRVRTLNLTHGPSPNHPSAKPSHNLTKKSLPRHETVSDLAFRLLRLPAPGRRSL